VRAYGVYTRVYGVPSGPKFNFLILLVSLAFDVVVLQFVPTSAIEHSSFQFFYSNCRFDIVCFTIQLCSLKYSAFKFTQFNIQVYAIKHSTFEDARFRYPSASQSMTVSVGIANYQTDSPLVGASKGRSLYPRYWLLPRKWRRISFLFSAECTNGMVWGLTSLKHYGQCGLSKLWHYGNKV